MSGRSIQQEARAFLIWREGKSVDWDCTVTELAEATGLAEHQVYHICMDRKWPITVDTRGKYARGEPRTLTAILGGKPPETGKRTRTPGQNTDAQVRALYKILEELDCNDPDEILAAAN